MTPKQEKAWNADSSTDDWKVREARRLADRAAELAARDAEMVRQARANCRSTIWGWFWVLLVIFGMVSCVKGVGYMDAAADKQRAANQKAALADPNSNTVLSGQPVMSGKFEGCVTVYQTVLTPNAYDPSKAASETGMWVVRCPATTSAEWRVGKSGSQTSTTVNK